MSANSISTLSTKQAKQEAKLNVAQAKRQGKVVARDGTISGNKDTSKPYYRPLNTLDISELPTKYSGNSLINNPNSAGLIQGRPWKLAPSFNLPAGMDPHEPLEGSGGGNSNVPGTTYLSAVSSGINAAFGIRGTPYNPGGNLASVPNSASGLYRTKYLGNLWSTYGAFSEFDVTWFDNPTIGPIGVEIFNYAGFGQRTDLTAENNYTLQWKGYFQAPATGSYNIWTAGTDDDAACWIGTDALTPTYANMNGRASGDRVLSLNSVNLTAGQWYPIRFVFTEFTGWEQCQWFIQDSTHGVLYNGTDLTWAYNSSTNGY